MDKELEREFITATLPVYAAYTALGGEAAKTFGEQTAKQIERLLKITFPHQQHKDTAQRQAQEMKMVDQVFEAFGFAKDGAGKVVEKPPEPEKPKGSMWTRLKDKLKGGKS